MTLPLQTSPINRESLDAAHDRDPSDALQHRIVELEHAVSARDEFIATVAHELRNPLTPLVYQARAAIIRTEQTHAAGEPISVEWVESQFRRFEQRLHRMLETLDRVLDVSRLSTGRIELELEVVDLSGVAHDVIALFEPELAVARCEVRYTHQEGVTGFWDRVRLEQICRNLISNAMRYGAGAPIDVRVSGDDRLAVLEVSDHGIGIAPEHQERIFERFERASSENRRGGFGVGLWVARNLCAAMHGTIAVESEIGRGARFTVTLPRWPGRSHAGVAER